MFRCSQNNFHEPKKPELDMKPQIALVLALFFALSAIAPAATQSILTVAVYDFTDPDKNPDGYGNKVTALVTADLTVETNLVMVERADLKKALGEQAIGASGMVSSDTAAKIGQITGAKVLVAGQVIKAAGTHLVIVANIIGTETGRLFAVKEEGAAEDLLELTSQVSRKIAQTIVIQTPNLIMAAKETSAARLDRIVKSLQGTNRPTVSVGFHHPKGPQNPGYTANTEMGLILQRAGFAVVDGNSDRKPDVVITGVVDVDGGPSRAGLHTEHAVIEMKVQEQRTGLIIAMDRQESVATDVAQMAAQRAAQALAVDELAERVLPLLAK